MKSKEYNSRQYNFINNKYGFSISIISGKDLMTDIEEIHNIGPNAESFYKKTILSTAQLVNFIKPGEQLGFYIDSEEPYFRFKIELSQKGTLRTLLLPEEFSNFPEKFTGNVRLMKVFGNKQPYTSILDYQNHDVENLVNEVMEKSYQTNSRILTAKDSLASIMITKLPPTNVNKKIDDYEDKSLGDFIIDQVNFFNVAMTLSHNGVEEIVKLFEENDYNYLSSKEIKFHCPCSKERMVSSLYTLRDNEKLELFKDEDTLETRCDYCNTLYSISKDEVYNSSH